MASAKKVAVKEVVFDSSVSDIQWLGADLKTVLVLTAKGRLYRSTTGGEKWGEVTDQLQVAGSTSAESPSPGFVADDVWKHPADSNIVLVSSKGRDHFVTQNRGETWSKINHQSTIHTIIFHKTRPKWALISTWTDACDKIKKKKSEEEDGAGRCYHMLYLTKDLGLTTTLLATYVVQFSWGSVTNKQQDRVYFTHFRTKTGDQQKLYMWSQQVDFAFMDTSISSKATRLVQHGNKFLVSNNFIFVAKLKDATSQTVTLMVSNDGGSNFRPAKLPQEIDEKSYTILDTSEGAVMLHVNHGSTAAKDVGNLYISDDQGVRYTLSLENNVRASAGDCEFDKVLSLDGVYLANFKDVPKPADKQDNAQDDVSKQAEQLEKEASKGTEVDERRSTNSKGKEESIVRTVISFDKGAEWGYLKPPRVDSVGKTIDCPPSRCWLHLHGITNFHNYAPFYSTENAVGIIMGTGNTGPYLRFEADAVNTYLSRDGGLSWVEAHKGAFIYEFGDHGGLLVMADDVRKTKQVVFSWNEGQSWYDFELSGNTIEVDNVVTEPNATSTKFLIYGTRGEAGVMYHLDFEALGQPLCKGVWAADSVSSDYETWTASDGKSAEKCMMGRQVTYTRRKQTSECFNGEKFERPVVRKNCACTEENFQCDMGFARKINSMDCKWTNDGSSPVPEKCTSSDFFFTIAHRKVIGDTCEGGWQPQKVAVPCPAGSKLSRGAMSVLVTIGMVGCLLAVVTYLSRSERFKQLFSNPGFNQYDMVKYATIGARTPETALESVGARLDEDFIEGDQDDYANDAPQLMAYAGRDRDRGEGRSEPIRRFDTAASQVPKLARPPGHAAGFGNDDNDLL